MARSQRFAAPKEIRGAHFTVVQAASGLANKKMRERFLDPNSELGARIAQTNKQSLAALRSGWSPLKPDWHRGLCLTVRDSELWLLQEPYYPEVEEIVEEAMTEAIMRHAEAFIGPLLRDAFTSDDPYYPIDEHILTWRERAKRKAKSLFDKIGRRQ